MNFYVVIIGVLSLCVLLGACDNSATSNATRQTAQSDTSEHPVSASDEKVAGLIRLATQGDPESQYEVGRAYYGGIGVEKDLAKARAWYEKAAAQGNADAELALGQIYDDVEKDFVKARAWYEKSAAQSNATAQLLLGHMYLTGEGVEKDLSKARAWYEKAAAQGDANAQFNLGQMYFQGLGVNQDYAKAREWLEKAAAQGVANAQLILGGMYVKGVGVPQDFSKAREWLEKSAAQGNAIAQATLGAMYVKGVGVDQDYAKAREWLEKAAAQGNARAQYWLGEFYRAGKGAPRDLVLAYAWFNIAASRGDADAAQSRDELTSYIRDGLAEAQRISSAWKVGTVLQREGTKKELPEVAAGSPTKQATGTAFVVSHDGRAVSNAHVVRGCSTVRVAGKTGTVNVLTEDTINDLVLLQLPVRFEHAASLLPRPTVLRQGEEIVVFGYPLDSVLSSGGNLTPGVVSAVTGLGNNTNQIQITAPIQPGSSGSPVLNRKGEVVGVVALKLSDLEMLKGMGQVGQNVNFAVNVQTLRAFLDNHKINYQNGAGFFSGKRSTVDLASEAQKWTLLIECWN